jgi:ketosteroid isomerase-like protein
MLDEALRARIEQGYAAFFAGELDGARAFMADDIVGFDAPEMPDAGEYHGADAVIARLAGFRELFEGIELRDMAVEELAGRALVVIRVHARSPATDIPVEVELAYLLTIRDGKATELRSFMAEDRAREYAAGS